jgi:hypothetical protein
MSILNTMDDYGVIFYTHPEGRRATWQEASTGRQHSRVPLELPLHLDRDKMEVWASGFGMYAELLADTEFQTVKERKLTKEKIR